MRSVPNHFGTKKDMFGITWLLRYLHISVTGDFQFGTSIVSVQNLVKTARLRNNQRNTGNCNFQNKIWYRSGPGGTELVVPKLYWWWSRTRHRVSCGTEMDRYRNRSPRRPEMVVVGLVIKYFSESILRPLSCCAQGQLPPSAPRSLRHCYFPPFYEFKLLKLLDSRY